MTSTKKCTNSEDMATVQILITPPSHSSSAANSKTSRRKLKSKEKISMKDIRSLWTISMISQPKSTRKKSLKNSKREESKIQRMSETIKDPGPAMAKIFKMEP
jgi:hypothetical protein